MGHRTGQVALSRPCPCGRSAILRLARTPPCRIGPSSFSQPGRSVFLPVGLVAVPDRRTIVSLSPAFEIGFLAFRVLAVRTDPKVDSRVLHKSLQLIAVKRDKASYTADH